MDFHLQSIQPFLPPLLLLLLAILLLAGSWWSYRTTELHPKTRWILIVLRSSSFLILLLLLLNPFVQRTEVTTTEPRISVYFDDSRSMSAVRGNYRGAESYLEMIEDAGIGTIESAVTYWRFDHSVEPANPFEMQLEGGSTDLHTVLTHIREHSDRYVASILFSDGIVTRGSDPVSTARELSIPLFVIPVGDPDPVRDVAVTDVVTNDTGYLDTRQIADVSIRQNEFAGDNAQVILLKNDEPLENREIHFSEDQSVHALSFELEFSESGLQAYRIYIPPLADEENIENNNYPFAVEVQDDNIQIISLSWSIHPDVGAIRHLLMSDRSIHMTPFTWAGERFIEGDPTVVSEWERRPDLLLIHGEAPQGYSMPPSLHSIPTIEFSMPGANHPGSTLGIEFEEGSGSIEIRLSPAKEGMNHPISDLPAFDYNRSPGLYTPDGIYSYSPSAIKLFDGSHQGQVMNLPVILAEEAGNLRHVVVNAFGWYRYLQSPDEEIRQFARVLIQNLSAWAQSPPDMQNLKITPVKRVFFETEPAGFRGTLRNESGEPESNASIEFNLTGNNGETRIWTMKNIGGGQYELNTGSLTAGTWRYYARALRNGLQAGETEGEFSVTESSIEMIDTRREDERLRQLAEASGGTILSDPGSQALVEELNRRDLLQAVEHHRPWRFHLNESYFWFLILIMLLTGEWVIRQRSSLP
ncbi:MAG: hypothetical protein WDZ29_03575 [Balneolaceae bacterium]